MYISASDDDPFACCGYGLVGAETVSSCVEVTPESSVRVKVMVAELVLSKL